MAPSEHHYSSPHHSRSVSATKPTGHGMSHSVTLFWLRAPRRPSPTLYNTLCHAVGTPKSLVAPGGHIDHPQDPSFIWPPDSETTGLVQTPVFFYNYITPGLKTLPVFFCTHKDQGKRAPLQSNPKKQFVSEIFASTSFPGTEKKTKSSRNSDTSSHAKNCGSAFSSKFNCFGGGQLILGVYN